MTAFGQDRAARFKRLPVNGGKSTTLTVGTSNGTHTLDAKCVAFALFNYGTSDVFFTANGSAATTAAGFPLLAKTQFGFLDCVGSVVLNLISGTAGQRVEVLEILDA